MPDLLAGEVIQALDTPPMNSDREDGSYTVVNGGFGVGVSSGTYADCACTFIAGTTGKVRIDIAARMANSSTGQCLVAVEVRQGGTIGSGTIVLAAADQLAITQIGTNGTRTGVAVPLTGLTPGATYNARLLHRVSANTGTFLYRTLVVTGES